MPRTIAEIEKLIEAKEKMAEKNEKEIPKVENECKELAVKKVGLDKKIDKESNKQEKAKLEKERDKVIQDHKSAKIKQDTIEKATTEIQKALVGLKEELKQAKEGVKQYGLLRQAGVDMLAREGQKLKTHCDKAKKAADDAEEASRNAERAAAGGDVNGAQAAKVMASNSVWAATEAAREAEALIKEITNTMTATQRNLKAAKFKGTNHQEYELTNADVRPHNNLTKKVQDDFKILEQTAGGCPVHVHRAETAAAEAAEFADATGVGMDLYERILDKALSTAPEQLKKIMGVMANKWGGYITNKGELFTRLLDAVKKDPTNADARLIAEKAVEQGQTYLASTMSNVDDMITSAQEACKRAAKRVPDQYARALKGKADKLNLVVLQLENYRTKVRKDYEATDAEFQKLVQAVE